MACLHLAERCATILASVRTEVDTAGPDVQKTLDGPLGKLNATFHEIEEFMEEYAISFTGLNVTHDPNLGKPNFLS